MHNLPFPSLQERKILLRTDTPLYPLMRTFPDGVPVKLTLLSLDGWDCYEFCPSTLPDTETMTTIAAVLMSEDYPEDLLYGFFRHHVVPIPCEWAIEFRGEVAA